MHGHTVSLAHLSWAVPQGPSGMSRVSLGEAKTPQAVQANEDLSPGFTHMHISIACKTLFKGWDLSWHHCSQSLQLQAQYSAVLNECSDTFSRSHLNHCSPCATCQTQGLTWPCQHIYTSGMACAVWGATLPQGLQLLTETDARACQECMAKV